MSESKNTRKGPSETKNGRFKDMSGQRYGRLVVVWLHEFRNHNSYWLCQCDCGNTKVVFGAGLRYGSVKSCGCLRKEVVALRRTTHGYCSAKNGSLKAYMSWMAMLSRCTNPLDDSFKHYGERGISVCERWEDFDNFFQDMGEPEKGLTLDRIDNEKGYHPENCRWSDIITQNRNKRTVLKYEFNGVSLTLPEWSERTGIPRARLWQRMNVAKWTIEKALTTPTRA